MIKNDRNKIKMIEMIEIMTTTTSVMKTELKSHCL